MAQDVIVLRRDPKQGGATSTARLKSGADDSQDKTIRWARRDLRPTGRFEPSEQRPLQV